MIEVLFGIVVCLVSIFVKSFAKCPNSIQDTKQFRNRASYIGDMVNGKACGRGVLTYSDGRRYEGEWIDDKRGDDLC